MRQKINNSSDKKRHRLSALQKMQISTNRTSLRSEDQRFKFFYAEIRMAILSAINWLVAFLESIS